MYRTILIAVLLCGVTGAAGKGEAAPPLLRGSILFSGGPGGLEERYTPRVYAANARGGKLREVLVDAEEPRWSPDGRRLAFLRQAPEDVSLGNTFDLFVMRANGSAQRRVTRLQRPDVVSDPNYTWSPDGRRIVYRDVVAGKEVITVIGVNGRHRRRIAKGETPIWSPDGSRIAFVGEDDTLPDVPGREGSLFVVRPDGSSLRQVTHGVSVFPMSPQSWSPDGRFIAFYPCCLKGFAVVDVVRATTRRFLNGKVANPSWAPNGKWIAVSADGTWLIRPDGTGLRRISKLGSPPFYPAWAPDSSALAIEDRCCAPDVWVVPVSGARSRRLTRGWRYGYGNYDPAWQPASLPTSKLGGRYVAHSNPTDSLPEGRLLRTTRSVEKLAADGSAVAVDYQGRCNGTEVWEPASRLLVRFRGDCGRVGFAGAWTAWVDGPSSQMGGDDWWVGTATVDVPGVDTVSRIWGRTRPLSDLVGDGSLSVFSSWGPCRISQDPPCASEPKTNGELYRLDGKRAVSIARSAAALTPLSVDAGRILVDHENGMLELLRGDGSSLRSFALNAAIVRGVRLQGRDLVVLTTTSVEVTDAETGAFLRRWPLPLEEVRLEDVQGGIAVLVAETQIHLLRLLDGGRAEIHAPGSGPVLAQLEPGGLFYSYKADDAKYPGRVAFIPYDDLPLR